METASASALTADLGHARGLGEHVQALRGIQGEIPVHAEPRVLEAHSLVPIYLRAKGTA